jgi:hypothetical protein
MQVTHADLATRMSAAAVLYNVSRLLPKIESVEVIQLASGLAHKLQTKTDHETGAHACAPARQPPVNESITYIGSPELVHSAAFVAWENMRQSMMLQNTFHILMHAETKLDVMFKVLVILRWRVWLLLPRQGSMQAC